MKKPFGFLDMDGVMNSRSFIVNVNKKNPKADMTGLEYIDPDAVKILNKIHQEHEPEWILSSTWRIEHTVESINKILKQAGFISYISKMTPYLSSNRGHEIYTFLQSNNKDNRPFFILDDDGDMDPVRYHLIKTTFDNGLKDYHIKEVRAVLKKQS